MDRAKVASVLGWSPPTSVNEFRSFLGLFGYYRCFIQSYGPLAKPLTLLLKKAHLGNAQRGNKLLSISSKRLFVRLQFLRYQISRNLLCGNRC